MGKTRKLLAAVAVLLGCGGATAQSSLTLFGIVDLTMEHGSGSGPGAASRNQIVSSGMNTSRLGLRGVEDLGGGMSASFWLEGALLPQDGEGQASNSNNQASGASKAPSGTQGIVFNRRSTVSLNGRWGEIRLGRNNAPHIESITLMDPFTNLGVGAAQSFISAATIAGPTYVRVSNSISYLTPGCSSPAGCRGFWAHAMYFMGENPSNAGAIKNDGSGTSVRAGYGSDNLYVALSAGKTHYASGDIEIRNLGVQYILGPATFMGHLASDRVDSPVPVRGRGGLVGVNYALGTDEIKAAYSRYTMSSGLHPQSSKLALGYVHNFSKRTAFYATLATVRNRGGATQAVGGSVTAPNSGSRGYDLGVRHLF